jgi:hypothetical protein
VFLSVIPTFLFTLILYKMAHFRDGAAPLLVFMSTAALFNLTISQLTINAGLIFLSKGI